MLSMLLIVPIVFISFVAMDGGANGWIVRKWKVANSTLHIITSRVRNGGVVSFSRKCVLLRGGTMKSGLAHSAFGQN